MPTRENRCTLTRDHQLGVDDLEHLVSRLRRATRRAESVRDWANCVTTPTCERVDDLLYDLTCLVDDVHRILDGGIRLV